MNGHLKEESCYGHVFTQPNDNTPDIPAAADDDDSILD
jgi:hypothetical protein